jgi:DNA-binding response OmpR family regulator
MKRKILVVDDEKTLLIAYKKLFGNIGIQVDTAGNMESSLDYIKNNRYDCVFLDLVLDTEKGYEGLELIREVKRNGIHTPVIVVTAYGKSDIKRKALENGANLYLEKPVPFARIRETLNALGVE